MQIKLASIARRNNSDSPMEEVFSAEISQQEGLAGDSKGKHKARQITVLSKESWVKACHELGEDLHWTERRANLLIKGFEFLPTDVGRSIHIGDVILEITGETDPCWKMDRAHAGLKEALAPSWRGGVCCTVIQGGTITSGDSVELGKSLF
jgi:MOSC domain-containing protein YiiM